MSELTIVKVGTGVVSNQERTKLDRETIQNIGDDLDWIESIDCDQDWTQHSVVMVSSGAVTAGVEKLRLRRQSLEDVRVQQLAAMTGNIALCNAWEAATNRSVAFDLPTHNDLQDTEHWDNLAGAIVTALDFGLLPVLNEGDARSTEELQKTIRRNGGEFKRFGDNDQFAAHLAIRLGAFAMAFEERSTRVIFLTDVDGVREDAAREDSVIEQLRPEDINEVIINSISMEGISNGGMLSKLLAAKDLALAGISVSIGAGKGEHALRDLYEYAGGTHILV